MKNKELINKLKGLVFDEISGDIESHKEAFDIGVMDNEDFFGVLEGLITFYKIKGESKEEEVDHTLEPLYTYTQVKEMLRDLAEPLALALSEEFKPSVEGLIESIKKMELDGETMQYILEEVGMDEQMLKQLSRKKISELKAQYEKEFKG